MSKMRMASGGSTSVETAKTRYQWRLIPWSRVLRAGLLGVGAALLV